jgi:hypothetical protein
MMAMMAMRRRRSQNDAGIGLSRLQKLGAGNCRRVHDHIFARIHLCRDRRGDERQHGNRQ